MTPLDLDAPLPSVAAALGAGLAALRAQLADRTAEVAVLCPSAGNGVLARRALAETGPFVRVRFTSPEALVADLGALALAEVGLEPEPAGWLPATLRAALPSLAAAAPAAEVLADPGWISEVQRTVERLEAAGVEPEALLDALAGTHHADRGPLLAALLEAVAAARTREQLYGRAVLAEAALAKLDDPRLPANRPRAVLVLGDRTLAPREHDLLAAWLQRRPGLRIALPPLHALPPAPLGITLAAAHLPAISVVRPPPSRLGALAARLFAPPAAAAGSDASVTPEARLLAPLATAASVGASVTSAAADPDASVTLAATPDEVHEVSEAVRFAQRAIAAGTPLDRIALVLPDPSSAEALELALDRAGLPATWLTGPALASRDPARLLGLCLELARGTDTIPRWYALLTHPALALRAKLGPRGTKGAGRWRRILANAKAPSGAARIARAVQRSLEALGPDAPGEERAAHESLVVALLSLGGALAELPRRAPLGAHARAWLAFSRGWVRRSADRSILEGFLAGFGRGDTGPLLELSEAAELLEDGLRGAEVARGQLTEPKLRVMAPMGLLGGDFDVTCVVGLAEGRFPRVAREDVLLPDELIAALVERGARLLPSRTLEDQERRRLAVVVGSTRGALWLSLPQSELTSGRPVRPGRLALEVASALLGRRATHEDLVALRVPVGRAWTTPLEPRATALPDDARGADPEDALSPTEHLIARLARDARGTLPRLVAHPVARRQLALLRSVEAAWRARGRGELYADAFTGLVPGSKIPSPLLGHAPASLGTFRRGALEPSTHFFRDLLGAWPAPRLPDGWDPAAPWRVEQGTLRALEVALRARSRALMEAFFEAWDLAAAEELEHYGEAEPGRLALARELAGGLAKAVRDRVGADAQAVTIPEGAVHEALPWRVRPSEALETGDELVTLLGRGKLNKRLTPTNGFEVALAALAKVQAGAPPPAELGMVDLAGDRCSGAFGQVVEGVLELAQLAVERAKCGLWLPSGGSSPFTLAREHEALFDPTQPLPAIAEVLR